MIYGEEDHMAAFFIERPVFAWVIALLISLGGGVALFYLPVAHYPDIAPPEISITARYPGASATTMDSSVTQLIEQQLNGIDGLVYTSSNSDSSGQALITLTFRAGTNIDVAQMQVQNKVQIAAAMLPDEVQRQGLRVAKVARNYILIPCFYSEDGSLSSEEIADYVASHVQDVVNRVPGVSTSTLYGSQYAMRIWCDPVSLERYGMTPSDVIAAVRAQNTQVSGGQLGAAPASPGQEINITVEAVSRLEHVEQFENILLRVDADGSAVFLKNVARIELASESFTDVVRLNGKPASGLGISLAPGANALVTADAVKETLESLSRFFPPSLKVEYSYDGVPFVRISIREVFKTLAEAVVLVFLVMYLFMQNWRATLVPVITVPIVLLGTFGILAIADFSINTLTLFGMVLSIGLLVDDAIVVVENTERLIREEYLSPKDAARKSMRQISGALTGITLVLISVFIPMAFFGGSAGVMYRQFAVTLVASMALSLLVALVLSPALCATLLKPHVHDAPKIFFARFNSGFTSLTDMYQKSVCRMLAKPLRWLLVYGGVLALTAFLAWRLPAAFLPAEDQGRMFALVQLPPGASMERTLAVMEQVENYFLEQEADVVESLLSVVGRGFNVNGQNTGATFIRLRDWSQRGDARQKVAAIQARAAAHFADIQEGVVIAFSPPAVPELGNASGFDFMLTDRAGHGHQALMEVRDQLLAKARRHPTLRNVRPTGLDDVEQYKLDINFARAGALGISPEEINTSINAYWGGIHINDFIDRGRSKRVYLQADTPYRMQADDFRHYHARNASGGMVPFSAFMSGSYTYGSPRLERFNGLSAVEIMGEAAPGKSTGQAMAVMEKLADELPEGFDYAWSGISLQEKSSGAQAPLLYALSMVVVFLCLAALYESWSLPLAVILTAPLGMFGVFAGAWFRGMNNDIYFQIGLLTIIGLAARNAVFIVEFAKKLVESGHSPLEATLQAVRARLRPILITTLAFIFGVLPLALSSGAGSGGQNSLGTGVVGGMITASLLGLYFTPLFFLLINRCKISAVTQKMATM